MTEQVKHTPGPWKVCGGYTPHYKAIHSPGGYIVFSFADPRYDTESGEPIKAPSDDEQAANAKFIVRACNSHDALLAVVNAAEQLIMFAGATGSWRTDRIPNEAMHDLEGKLQLLQILPATPSTEEGAT